MKIILLAFTLLLIGCANNPTYINPQAATNPKDLFTLAQQSFERKRYDLALQALERLDTNYPFSPFSSQVKLSLAYARYKSNKIPAAITSLSQYLSEKPYSQQAPYAWYLRGLAYQEWSFGFFTQQLGETERSNYDLISLKRAYSNFEKIVNDYPNSIYSLDAAFRMKIIKEQLATAEITVGTYYLRRNAYVAALNRAYYNLTVFDGSPSNEKALELLIKGYTSLGRAGEAHDAYRILALNFPENQALDDYRQLINRTRLANRETDVATK